MKKILFVCLGNICRSPMAEYILRDMAQKRGIAVNVASAGTSGWHDGEYMHCSTAEILDGLSIESRDFRSRKIPADALQYYDYVIVMDDSNLRDVQAALGRYYAKRTAASNAMRIIWLNDVCRSPESNNSPLTM